MTDDEERERFHDQLAHALGLEEELLTGWLVVYETQAGERAFVGCRYGPSPVTWWRALGLAQWAREWLGPGPAPDAGTEDEDEER